MKSCKVLAYFDLLETTFDHAHVRHVHSFRFR
jgi:hypothetical protein